MREKIFELLNKLKISYENYEHEAVFTCDEAKWIEVPWKRVKNLLIRNEKKTKFYMVVIEDEKRIDNNSLRKLLNESKLSFASRELMLEKIWVEPWHVSPFAMINNQNKDIKIIFDLELKDELVWFHPLQNDNTTVLEMKNMEIFLNDLLVQFEYLEL
jgi:Ala-tRNA(Pro) deacylase